MKHTPLTLTTLTILTALALVTSGCGKKAEQTATIDSNSDLEVLAGLSEGAGSAQNSVEFIQVPQGQQAIQGGMDATQQAMQQGVQQTGQIAISASSYVEDATRAAKSGDVEYAKKVQTALKNAGLFTGSIDGKIGPKTKEAIKAFQSQNGLTADGVPGAQTWVKLAQYYASGASTTTTSSTTAE